MSELRGVVYMMMMMIVVYMMYPLTSLHIQNVNVRITGKIDCEECKSIQIPLVTFW